MKNFKRKISVIIMMLVIISAFAGCSKKESNAAYVKGTLTENSYESEFLNIKFTMPEGYSMLSEDDMDQYVKFTAETIYKDKSQSQIDYAKAVTVYEMMCTEATQGNPNVNIVVENLLGRDISLDDYIEAAKQQLQATGIEYTFGDVIKDVTFAGEKYAMLDCVGVYAGQELSQQMYVRKVGDRMVLLTVTSTEDKADMKDELLAGFTSYK